MSLRDELLVQRATQTYLWALSPSNTLGTKVGSLPANIPAANFWSVTLYEAENASGYASGRAFPSLDSRDKSQQNVDDSTGSPSIWSL